jgi:hypothetical protein
MSDAPAAPVAEVLDYEGGLGGARLLLFCPGCETHHAPEVRGAKAWTWNGSLTSPTLSPSILVNRDDPAARCHSFVRDGQWRFLSDCHHDLAGKTVPVPPINPDDAT